MVRLETETDIETLRQAAILYQREYQKLVAKMAELMKELAELKGESEKGAQLRIAALEQHIAILQQKLFGESSEKRPASEEGAKPAEEKKPRKGHGPRSQPALPVREVIHQLDEADKACPCCGSTMEEWDDQFEESEEINIIPRQYELVRHKRQKYRCKCNGSIETAPGPQKLHEGARYSIDFAIEVVAAKYLEHMPLERQVRSMAHDGLIIDSQTLWDQCYSVALILKPGYDRLLEHQLSMPVLGGDETTWRLLERNGKPSGSKRCFVWCNVSANAVYYKILASRSAAAGEEIFKGYQGIVMADGYGAYSSMSETIGFTLASCRVGGGVTAPAPHRSGRADFPHPVLHGADSLAAA
jgi:transposase